MTFGIFELAILLFIVFLILGPKRIQSLLGALGRGIRDFKLEFGKDKEDGELPEGEDREGRLRKK